MFDSVRIPLLYTNKSTIVCFMLLVTTNQLADQDQTKKHPHLTAAHTAEKPSRCLTCLGVATTGVATFVTRVITNQPLPCEVLVDRQSGLLLVSGRLFKRYASHL